MYESYGFYENYDEIYDITEKDNSGFNDSAYINTYRLAQTGYLIFKIILIFTIIFAPIYNFLTHFRIFIKSGVDGWKAIIPIYNTIVLHQIVGLHPLIMLLYIVPILNIIVYIMMCFKLAEVFGKGIAFTIGLIFLNPIFMMILSFSNAKYQGT